MPRRGRAAALGPPLALAALAAAGCAAVLLADPTTPGGWLPTCPTKALAGVCCPGCGGLRMLYSLLHGDIGAALRYNAVSFVFLGLFAWAAVAWTVSRVRGRHVRSWLHWKYTPHVVIPLLIVWFVVRNLPMQPFAALSV
ncbi:DUF2752 domain-containing protein [Actinokineospora sp. NPDC004072]